MIKRKKAEEKDRWIEIGRRKKTIRRRRRQQRSLDKRRKIERERSR